MPSWGSDLPQAFDTSGFSYAPRDGTLRLDPAYGDSITRTAFSGYMADIAGNLPGTMEEATALVQFWRDDLSLGALPFDWVDPFLGDACSMMFAAPPQVSETECRWICAVKLIRQP